MNTRRLVSIIILSGVMGILHSPDNQASSLTKRQLDQQRQLFLKAEYAAGKRKSRDYPRLYQKLQGYPLQPYVQLKYLKKHTYWRNRHEIRDFLEQYKDTPLEWPLRKKWLYYLAKRDKAKDFLADYRPNNDSALHCYQLRYALATGSNETGVFTQVDQLWIHKKSQPKACDPLFKLWEEAGWRSNDKIWARLVLAASKGDHTLIPYLKTLTPVDEKYLADLWYKTRRSPATVARMDQFPKASDKEKVIALYGIKRLAWQDKDLALRSWSKLQKKFTFSPTEQLAVTKVLARRLAQINHPKASDWLDNIPADALTDELVQWQVANALRQGNWHKVLSIVQHLPDHLADKTSWRYWLARALTETGDANAGQQQLISLAKQRDYYGFLAASLLGEPPNLNHRPLQFTPQQLNTIGDSPAAQRALELRHFKRWTEARREWHSLMKQLNAPQQLAAAQWATNHDWPDRAIFTLAKHQYWDDINLRFPLAFQSTFKQHANAVKIEPAFTFAISRRESSFMPDANSTAGALGLMQMLPSTAKFIAKKPLKRNKLFQPYTNIKYGSKYLKYLLNRLDDNPITTAAAYNAGIHRVNRWTNLSQPLPVDVWIETIPFKETREYVKSVMTYRQIYSQRLGHQHNTFKPLINMIIGK